MKKSRIITLLFVVVLIFTFAWCSSQSQDYNAKYFGVVKYAETKHNCSEKDRKEVQQVLDDIENAFCYDDINEDCNEKLGVLSKYCLCKNDYPDVVREKHTIDFVTAKITGNSGYIWIRYNQEGFDGKSDEPLTGSWDILSRIEIAKKDGKWVAVFVDEAP